jgi:biopolymer transport protein ExbD
MIEATSALKRFAILTALLALLLFPLIVMRCSRTPFMIIERGESAAVPGDIINATPLNLHFDDDGRIIVSVPKDEDVYLGRKKVINRDDFRGSINQRLKTARLSERIVYVKSGLEVTYGSVVDVLRILRGTDMERVGLVVRRRKGASGGPAYAVLEVRLPSKYQGKKFTWRL